MAEVAAEKGFKKKTTMQELAEHVFFCREITLLCIYWVGQGTWAVRVYTPAGRGSKCRLQRAAEDIK